MSRIEEQQKAILNLKSNLMDDLTEKGILSSPECQKVIDIHNKEQEKLKKTLDEQRAKQEKVCTNILALNKRYRTKTKMTIETGRVGYRERFCTDISLIFTRAKWNQKCLWLNAMYIYMTCLYYDFIVKYWWLLYKW